MQPLSVSGSLENLPALRVTRTPRFWVYAGGREGRPYERLGVSRGEGGALR